jgi:hypothetical protein
MKVSGWLVTWAVCSWLGFQLVTAMFLKLGGAWKVAANVTAVASAICLIASIALVVAYFAERRGGRKAS